MNGNNKTRMLSKIAPIFNIITMAINGLYLIWWIVALIYSIATIEESNNFHDEVFIYVSIIFIIVSTGAIVLNIFAILSKKIRNPFSIIIAIYLIYVTYMFLGDRSQNVHPEPTQVKDVLELVFVWLLMIFSFVNAFVQIFLKTILYRNSNKNKY